MLIVPTVRRLRALLSRVLGGNDTIARRLRQAGSDATVERFRGEQLAWAGPASQSVRVRHSPPCLRRDATVARLAVPAFAAVAGAVIRDWMVQRAARRSLDRISRAAHDARVPHAEPHRRRGHARRTRRVARAGSGELPTEFARVVAAVGAGVPLPTALAEMRDGLEHPALTRALDQVLGALDRGAHFAAVLRAQAGDARAEAKRTIIEVAGRKEIAMLVPLIFLILPVTIAFALFPGYLELQAGLMPAIAPATHPHERMTQCRRRSLTDPR